MERDFQFYKENALEPMGNCIRDLTSDNKIESEYNARNIREFLTDMCDKHGYDVVATVLSNHVNHHSYDGRYSTQVKNWADNYQSEMPIRGIPHEVLERFTLGNVHPVVVNSSANWVANNEKELKEKETKADSTADEKTSETSDHKSYTEQLFEKMSAEQDSYRNWLLEQSPDEILNHTYEYTIRQDILLVVESGEITEDEAKALLDSPAPLSDVYDRFDKKDVSYMEDLRNTFGEIARDKDEKAAVIDEK